MNQKTIPLTEGMKEIVKHMRRGAELCKHSNGYFYLVTTANSQFVRSRDASGLLKRGMLQFDDELFGMDWYKLSELGKSINLD